MALAMTAREFARPAHGLAYPKKGWQTKLASLGER
jgi:hypothetical protein